MPYDQFGEWVQDFSDVDTSPDECGMNPQDMDTSTMMPDDMGPLTKDD
jgi:hypothetical protein